MTTVNTIEGSVPVDDTKLNVSYSSDGPPPGVSRRGRWAPAHAALALAKPGEWVTFSGLTRKDGQSLRAALVSRCESVTSRYHGDDTVDVWALREPQATS